MLIQYLIYRKRLEVGMTRKELSRRSGVKYRNLVYWEDGQGDPPLTDCVRIARGLGITIEELVSGVTLPEDEED